MVGLQGEYLLEIDRGPDWLFVRAKAPAHEPLAPTALAEQIWRVAEQHFTYRVVLEMDEVPMLHSHLVGQLVLLSKRLHSNGGVLRLCALSEVGQSVLRTSRLDEGLVNYACRADAVMGRRMAKPR